MRPSFAFAGLLPDDLATPLRAPSLSPNTPPPRLIAAATNPLAHRMLLLCLLAAPDTPHTDGSPTKPRTP